MVRKFKFIRGKFASLRGPCKIFQLVGLVLLNNNEKERSNHLAYTYFMNIKINGSAEILVNLPTILQSAKIYPRRERSIMLTAKLP